MVQSASRGIADNRFPLRLLFHMFAHSQLSQVATKTLATLFPQEKAVELLCRIEAFIHPSRKNFVVVPFTEGREVDNRTSVESPYQTLLILHKAQLDARYGRLCSSLLHLRPEKGGMHGSLR
jgi:hypothetical protein